MKYILLIMTILQLKLFWNEFKGIFTTNKQDKNSLDKIMSAVDSKDKELFNGMMILMMFVFTMFLSVYYILIGIYLEGILFVALSCWFTIRAWQTCGRTIERIGNKENEKEYRKTIFSRASHIANLVYIGYFIYFLITSW